MSDQLTLGDVLLDIQAGKSFQTAEVLARPDELGVLKVSAVTWSDFQPDEAKALNGEYKPDASHCVRKGDLLISRANTKEFVGAVVLVNRDYPFRLLSDKTLRLVIDEGRASKEYLLFALRAPKARRHIEHYATGTSDSMRNIAQGVITSVPIDLPPLCDQRHIAARLKAQLAELETARQAAQTQLRESKSLIDAILRQGAVVSDIEPLVLGDVVRIDARIVDPTDPALSSLPHVSAENISSVTGKLHHVRSAAEDGMESGKYLFDAGDVLYSKLRPYLRKATVANFAGLCSADMYPLKFDDNRIDPEYLRTVLVSDEFTAYANELSARSRMPKLNREQLLAYKFGLPSIDKQRRIVHRQKTELADAATLHAALTAQQHDLAVLPQRLLAQAFE